MKHFKFPKQGKGGNNLQEMRLNPAVNAKNSWIELV